MTRPCTKGPRSLIRTTTERPVLRFVTRTIVPNGSDRCAAVMCEGAAGFPLAVPPPGENQARATRIFPAGGACAAPGKATGKISAAGKVMKTIFVHLLPLFL